MTPRCTVCRHPKVREIDRALVSRSQTFRGLAGAHGLSVRALLRHSDDHVPAAIAAAVVRSEERREDDLKAELDRARTFVDKLLGACDRWLEDPDDPTRYDIGPRAEDLDVIYTTIGAKGTPIRRKRKLSALLGEVQATRAEVLSIELVETRHADPRELILKAVTRLQAHLELLAKIMGKIDAGTTVNVLVMPEWQRIVHALLHELAGHPDLKVRVAARLEAIAGEVAA